jgi:hypothetical protein
MIKSENGSEIFPVDSKGRVRVSPERREQLLDEFEKSGLSGAQFARAVGVKYQHSLFGDRSGSGASRYQLAARRRVRRWNGWKR